MEQIWMAGTKSTCGGLGESILTYTIDRFYTPESIYSSFKLKIFIFKKFDTCNFWSREGGQSISLSSQLRQGEGGFKRFGNFPTS